MIKLSLAIVLGLLVGFFSLRVVPLSDNEDTLKELNSYRLLGTMEGQALCQKRK